MNLEKRLRELESGLSGPDTPRELIPEGAVRALDDLAARKAGATTPGELEAAQRDIRAALAQPEGGGS